MQKLEEERQKIESMDASIYYENDDYWRYDGLPRVEDPSAVILQDGQYVDPTGEPIAHLNDQLRQAAYAASSPPSSTDVPGLARSGTVHSSASSYVESLSRSGSPESGMYMDGALDPYTMPSSYEQSPAGLVQDVVQIKRQGSSKRELLPYEIEPESLMVEEMEKPRSKKQRTAKGSNIFSRLRSYV